MHQPTPTHIHTLSLTQAHENEEERHAREDDGLTSVHDNADHVDEDDEDGEGGQDLRGVRKGWTYTHAHNNTHTRTTHAHTYAHLHCDDDAVRGPRHRQGVVGLGCGVVLQRDAK